MSRITDVESIVLLDSFQIVRVSTDDGFTGIGEVYPTHIPVTDAIVRDTLRPIVVGEPAADIERLWHRMYVAAYRVGPMGALLQAIGGIDIALWDILGQRAGVPIYELLGGAVRPRVELYASSMLRTMTPEEEGRRARDFKEKGFHGYKIHSATPWMRDVGFDQTIATVEAVRAAVGPDFPVLVDVNSAYYSHTAVRIARELERLGVWHFEEPLMTHDYAGYRELARTVDIPIAAGEQEYSPWQFRDLILQAEVDIIQPDIIKCGGFTSFVKIATLADTFAKPITAHNTQPMISTAAHLHVWLSQMACVYPQEYNIEPHPLRDEHPIFTEPLEIVDGALLPPTAPGLGVTLDEDVIGGIRSTPPYSDLVARYLQRGPYGAGPITDLDG